MIDDFKKNIFLASLFSFLFHYSIVLVLSEKNEELEVKKYSVVNLANFKDYVIPEIKQQIPKEEQKPIKKESVKKIEETLGKRPVTTPIPSVPAFTIPPPAVSNVVIPLAPAVISVVADPLCFIKNAFAAPSNDTSQPS